MKNILPLILVCLFGCAGKTDTSAPTSIANQYYKALQANNIETARTLLTNKENLPNDGSISFHIDKFEITKSTIDGKKATLITNMTNKTKNLTFDTILEAKNGEWKVNMQETMKNMMHAALEKNQISGKIKMDINNK